MMNIFEETEKSQTWLKETEESQTQSSVDNVEFPTYSYISNTVLDWWKWQKPPMTQWNKKYHWHAKNQASSMDSEEYRHHL